MDTLTALFSGIQLLDVHQTVVRNIVSLHPSQDLFDDLSPDPNAWALAQRLEAEVKPPPYQSATPLIHRPFEDAQWFSAIAWPFRHWQASRFSDGSFGVWYGSESIKTTVYETAYHWVSGLLRDAGWDNAPAPIITERKIYDVRCDAALLDLRPKAVQHPGLTHPSDYRFTHAVGARISQEGHPGLVTPSARRPQGHNYAVFTPKVLSTPQHNCQLTYTWHNGMLKVEKQEGVTWLSVAAMAWVGL